MRRGLPERSRAPPEGVKDLSQEKTREKHTESKKRPTDMAGDLQQRVEARAIRIPDLNFPRNRRLLPDPHPQQIRPKKSTKYHLMILHPKA